MNLFLAAAIALIAGLLMTRVTSRLKLPDVTAYLIAGLLVGPYCLGRLGIPGLGFNTAEELHQLNFISATSLGFIAFTIGNEFKAEDLKHSGKKILLIGILEGLMATVAVDLVLLAARSFMPGVLSPAGAIVLGAIAAATAPAATLMVVRQYKAKGPLVDVLLPVVALDDAVGLAIFAVSFGVAQAMSQGTVDAVSIALEPFCEIVLSLAMGALLGEVLTQLEKLFHSGRNRMALIVGFVLLTVALSMLEFDIGRVHISFSSLLVCMAMGVIFSNRCPLEADLMDKADKWTSPLFAMFFILSGAELELSVFKSLPVVALDDAVGLAIFAVSFGVAQAMSHGTVDPVSIAAEPLLQIVLSLAMGALLGEILTQLEKLFHSGRNRMSLIVGFVLLTVALSMLEFDIGSLHISFSSLLVCMAMGVIFCNRCPLADDLMDKADKWTSPLFAMFFILSGAELELSVFKSLAVVGIGLLYIIFRCVGKYAGAYLGATITGYGKNVRKWLGVTLFPQAGVALGMSVTVSSWGTEGALIRNIILFGVLIYELFGPVMTKFALTKAGDIRPKGPEIIHRRANAIAAKGK